MQAHNVWHGEREDIFTLFLKLFRKMFFNWYNFWKGENDPKNKDARVGIV